MINKKCYCRTNKIPGFSRSEAYSYKKAKGVIIVKCLSSDKIKKITPELFEQIFSTQKIN